MDLDHLFNEGVALFLFDARCVGMPKAWDCNPVGYLIQ